MMRKHCRWVKKRGDLAEERELGKAAKVDECTESKGVLFSHFILRIEAGSSYGRGWTEPT